MWPSTLLPRWSQASARSWSSANHSSASAAFFGKATTGASKIEKAWSRFPKHFNAVLLTMPRGSKPTRSKLARRFGEYRNGAPKTANSTPEPPGPPGLRNTDPTRWSGSVAGNLTREMPTVPPRGSSWSRGTPTTAHS